MRWTDPFLSSLRRHRLFAGLIALQAGTAALLLVLAVARIGELQVRIHASSGLDEARLLQVRVAGPANPSAQARERQALAALPGVLALARINQVPFGRDGWTSSIGGLPAGRVGTLPVAVYLGDHGLLGVLGLHLREGRDFLPGEYPPEPMRGTSYRGARHVLISQALADRLYPGGNALGQSVYFRRQPLRVVGIYGVLHGREPSQSASLILPLLRREPNEALYLLRLRDAAPDPATLARAARQGGRWHVDARTVARLRQDWFAYDRIGQLMIAVGAMLWLAGTAAGMANLADLLLQARLRQIGLRRALGACTGQIRWQLRRENLYLAGGGAALALLAWPLAWHLWPGLLSGLPMPSATQCMLAWIVVVATGQLALWPVAQQADAVPPTLASRCR